MVRPARINVSQEILLSVQPLSPQSTVHLLEYEEMPLMRDSSFIVHEGPEQPDTITPIMPAFM